MVKMEYIKKEYERTRKTKGKWYLSSYHYKFNITPFIPFFDMLKEKKLMGLKCRGCNIVYFPPKLVCGRCLAKPDKWVPLRETGVIATYTATFDKDPTTGELTPAPIIAVRQDGSDSLYIAELSPDVKFDEVYAGMPVKVKWRDTTQGNLSDIEYYGRVDDPTEKMELYKQEEE
jgi:hypothetical protein